MGFPGLNLPQQVPAPQGPQGGVVGPNPTAMNRDPHADQIVKGLGQLMTGYVGMQEAVKQHYGQKLDDAMLQIANGLNPNPDYDELMKWAKKSGRPYKTDMTSAELQQQNILNQQQKYQDTVAQAQQNTQQMSSQVSGLPPQAPGLMGSPGQPGVAAPGVVSPPSPQRAPLGFMDRLRQMAGMAPTGAGAPQVSAQSPFGHALQQLNQSAQSQGGAAGALGRGLQDSVLAHNMQQAAGKLGIAHDQSMAPVYSQLFQKALGGDLNTMTMMRRLGIFKDVPIDEMASLYKAENPGVPDSVANAHGASTLLWQQGGGPALQLKIADLAKDMIPRFGGDAGVAMSYTQGLFTGQRTGAQPGRTAEEFDKFASGSAKMAERFPAAPTGLIEMYANAKMAGKDSLAGDVLDFLSSHYKTQGQIGQSQFQSTLAKDYSQIASQNQIGNRDADAAMLRAYTGAIDTLEGPAKEILNDPKRTEHYTQKQINEAAERRSDLMNSLAGTPIKIGGFERPLAPLEEILNRNNVDDTHMFYGMGPKFSRGVLPTPAPAPQSGSADQLMQMLNTQPQIGSTVPGLQQMLLNRAQGR